MTRFSLALAALAVVAFAAPAEAGNGQYGGYYSSNSPYYAPPSPRKRQKRNTYRYNAEQERRALQIRSECRMYSFGYWRYHPDYQHCRYN